MASVRIYAKGVLKQQLDSLKIDRYTVVDRNGTTPVVVDGYHRVNSLGGGGFGVVIRAKDLVGLSRAIKLLNQPPHIFDESSTGTNLFVREIRLTNERTYKHIIPILDYGSVAVGRGAVSYYVSQYVDGLTLHDFCRQLAPLRERILADAMLRSRLRDLMLNIMRDVLSGLVELDSAAVVHMDLKHDNILVHPIAKQLDGTVTDDQLLDQIGTRDLHASVIDLGAGKPVSDGGAGRTTLRWTPYFFPPILDELGFEESDGKIESAALNVYWRTIDLYSAGRTFEYVFLDRVRRSSPRVTKTEQLTEDEAAKEIFWRTVFGDDHDVLEGLIDRLLSLAGGFETAGDALQVFETIPYASARSMYESDLLIGRRPISHTPVGSVGVHVGDPFRQIVEHPAFQRLRWIQQLAFVSEDLPDGNHTRYAHSLRCYEMARKVVMGLGRRSSFRLLFQRRDVEELLAAALLHDIGQYHFAHSIEDLKKLGDRTSDPDLSTIQHDQDLAAEMCRIKDEEGAAGVTIEEIIVDRCRLRVDNIYYMISKEARNRSLPPTVNFARDVVNGLVDVDRIAYLIHDSERTGVPYGKGIDVDRIVDALTLYVDYSGGMAPRVQLGVEEVGVSAVEVVLAAVYWMYREVYWQENNRAFMAAVKLVMMRLLRQHLLTFPEYRFHTHAQTDWHALKFLKHHYDRYLKDHFGVNPLADLTSLRGLRYSVMFSMGYGGGDKELYNRIVRFATADRLEKLTEAVGQFIGRGADAADGEVLVDVPLKRRLHHTGTADGETERETGASSHLWVCSRTPLTKTIRHWADIRSYSPLAERLGAVEDYSGRRIRLFAADALVGRMSVATRERVETELRSFIDEFTREWIDQDPK